MKESKNNNSFFKNGMNGLLIICGGIFFYYILFHSDKLYGLISKFLSIMTPLIAGLIIAYVLNPVMRFMETKMFFPLWNRIKSKKKKAYSKERIVIRVISAFLTLILFIAVIYALVMSIFPQLLVSIQSIIKRIPVYLMNVNEYYATVLSQYPKLEELLTQYSIDVSQLFYNKILPYFEDILSKTSTSLLGSIIVIFKSLLNFIIGIIISIHLLIDKEKFLAQSKKVLYAFLKRERANNFINNLRYSHKIFGGFITAKVIDSIIIGFICYFGMKIMNLPYGVLISVIVGITNVIPYFGPFIGAIPSAFFILMVDPKKCLIFVIFVIILQQFDGNILGPKILGDSTGLNSFWVIFSITVFSGLFGVAGMFIGVPAFAVIYAAFRTLINKRLEIKHMPVETSYYVDSDFDPDDDDIEFNSGKSFRFMDKTFDKVTKETYLEDQDREKISHVDALLNEKGNRTEQ
ncbi:MAG: AI-2E family transporter [Lachnospiraceae bacterium]|nr:AI-2E family transporter [Lachnospiraceae bacterium]